MSLIHDRSDWSAAPRDAARTATMGLAMREEPVSAPIMPNMDQYHATILGVSWALVAICIVVISLRFYIRYRFFSRWFSDDWFMLAAMVFQIVFSVFFTKSCIDSGDVVPGLPFNPDVLKMQILSGIFSMACPLFSRLSGAILLIRLFKTVTWLKWYLIMMTVGTWLTGLVCLTLLYGAVTPLRALWDPRVPAVVNWGLDYSQRAGIANGVFIATTDLTFVLFPTIIVSRFNMSPRRKLGLVLTMLLSLVTVAAAILKSITTLSGPEQTKKLGFQPNDASLWASVEQSLVIIIGSLLPLMPITKLDNKFVNFFKSVLGHIGSTGDSPSRSVNLPSFVRPAESRNHRDGTQRLHSPEEGGVEFVGTDKGGVGKEEVYGVR